MNNLQTQDYFLGKIIKVEKEIVYLKTIDFSLENKSYIIYQNKIYKTPYVGAMIKIDASGTTYVAKINSEKLFVDEKNKYKLYKAIIIGSLNRNSNIEDNSFTPQIGNSVFLFSNDDLDKIESIKTETGNYLQDVAIIKDNNGSLSLNVDLFATNILVTGNKNFGKTMFIFDLYIKLFKKYLDKFNKNQKFVFLNLNSDYKKNLKEVMQFHDKNNISFELNDSNNKNKIFNVKELTLKDYYLLGQVKNLMEERMANDFFQFERNKYQDYDIEEILVKIITNEKAFKHFKSLFKNLYDKRRELLKSETPLTKMDKYLNYAILNIYDFLNNVKIIQGELNLSTSLFQTNKEFKKAFSSIYRHHKYDDYIKLTDERFKWFKEFIFLKNSKYMFNILPEIKKVIGRSYKLKLNFFIISLLIKTTDYNYDQLVLFASRFIKNWRNIKNIFYYENLTNTKGVNNLFDNNNIFSFNLSNLFQDDKAIATTIITKRIYEKFLNIEEKEKIMNIVIDSSEQLLNVESYNNIYYGKYINNFFQYLLAKGKKDNVYSTYITLSPKNLGYEFLNLFNNYFIFNLTNTKDLQILFENFSVLEEDNIRKLRSFKYGDFYCFGKNFIRLIYGHISEKDYETKKEFTDQLTINEILS